MTITFDPATLQGYQTAVTALDFARRELTRMQNLLAQHLATNAQVATAQKAVDDAAVALETERDWGMTSLPNPQLHLSMAMSQRSWRPRAIGSRPTPRS